MTTRRTPEFQDVQYMLKVIGFISPELYELGVNIMLGIHSVSMCVNKEVKESFSSLLKYGDHGVDGFGLIDGQHTWVQTKLTADDERTVHMNEAAKLILYMNHHHDRKDAGIVVCNIPVRFTRLVAEHFTLTSKVITLEQFCEYFHLPETLPVNTQVVPPCELVRVLDDPRVLANKSAHTRFMEVLRDKYQNPSLSLPSRLTQDRIMMKWSQLALKKTRVLAPVSAICLMIQRMYEDNSKRRFVWLASSGEQLTQLRDTFVALGVPLRVSCSWEGHCDPITHETIIIARTYSEMHSLPFPFYIHLLVQENMQENGQENPTGDLSQIEAQAKHTVCLNSTDQDVAYDIRMPAFHSDKRPMKGSKKRTREKIFIPLY